jgi:hypothetical protein
LIVTASSVVAQQKTPDFPRSGSKAAADLEANRKRTETEGVNAWVDPEGYRRFVAEKRRAFEDEVDVEMGVV